MRDITDATIEQVLMLGKPVIIDFWASYCTPCRHLGPVINAIADANPDIEVCKVDVQQNSTAIKKYEISSIPVILFFNKDGKLVERIDGLRNQKQLQALIDEKLL